LQDAISFLSEGISMKLDANIRYVRVGTVERFSSSWVQGQGLAATPMEIL